MGEGYATNESELRSKITTAETIDATTEHQIDETTTDATTADTDNRGDTTTTEDTMIDEAVDTEATEAGTEIEVPDEIMVDDRKNGEWKEQNLVLLLEI